MKWLGPLVGIVLVAIGFATPIAVANWQMASTRHFYPVRPGVLYRSAQLPPEGLKRLKHDYNIRTVVCIRDESATTKREAEWCAKNEMQFFRFESRNWDGTPGTARVDPNLRQFLQIMRDPKNHPVLVHCFAGMHRTGGYVAVYRMECEGWTSHDAIEEMRARGYENIDTDLDIRQYLESYRPGVLTRR